MPGGDGPNDKPAALVRVDPDLRPRERGRDQPAHPGLVKSPVTLQADVADDIAATLKAVFRGRADPRPGESTG